MAPETSRPVLSPWQRPLVRLLLAGAVVLAGGGLFLLRTKGASPSAGAALLFHLVLGALLVPVLLAFSLPHAVVQTRRKPLIALSGAFVLLAGLAVAASGAYLAFEPRGSLAGDLWWAHVAGGYGLFALYALHRRFGTNPASWRRLVGSACAVGATGAAFFLWEAGAPGATSPFDAGDAVAAEATRPLFLPSAAVSGAGGIVPTADDIKDVASCVKCHRLITEEWKRSAHRHASMTNPFYRASVEDLRKRYPAADAQWCAACHDPALLFTGKMARADLDFESEDARVGLTCLSCHAIETKSTMGNGDYVMRSRKVYPFEKSGNPELVRVHDVLLRLNPAAHVESLRPKNLQEPGFCSTCHKAEPPPELNRWHWIRAQDEYDAHDDSGVSMGNARSFYHPPKAKRCQDCHMPLMQDPDDPAADDQGYVRSHLFGAANTALPWLRGDDAMIRRITTFLGTACRVDVTAVVLEGERVAAPAWRVKPAVRPGEVVEADVVVRNLGVGHRFPGGTVDSNEVWVRFEASLGDAAPFYVSGAVDPESGEVDPSAEFYRAFWMRRDGTRFVNRIANDLYTSLYVRRIGPGTADLVRYRFRVPEGAAGPLRLKATLRYRKFMKPFVDFVARTRGARGSVLTHRLESDYLKDLRPDDLPALRARGFDLVPYGEGRTARLADLRHLPVVDMATGTLDLPVTAQGTPGPLPAIEAAALPEDRDRVNDLAIALLLQGDPIPAERLFEVVTRIDPRYADGWVNVGRARIDAADWDGAWEALEKALSLVPGFPKALFFQAEILRRRTRFREAEERYRAVLEAFPRDREAFKRLAEVLYEQERYRDALEVLDRYMQIDAEDWNAWFWAMRSHKALGEEDAYLAAKAAHDRFRPDDDTTHRKGPDLLDDKNLHRLAQPIHSHEQPGLSK